MIVALVGLSIALTCASVGYAEVFLSWRIKCLKNGDEGIVRRNDLPFLLRGKMNASDYTSAPLFIKKI